MLKISDDVSLTVLIIAEADNRADFEHVEQCDWTAGPVRLVAMFMTVDKGVPAGNSSGSRGSCRLQGKVLPFVGSGSRITNSNHLYSFLNSCLTAFQIGVAGLLYLGTRPACNN